MLIRISTPFLFTAELSTNSLEDFVVFWNYDIQTVFHAVGLLLACWNYDLYTVSIHSGTFNEFPGGMYGILIFLLYKSKNGIRNIEKHKWHPEHRKCLF